MPDLSGDSLSGDAETGGFDPKTNALLSVGIVAFNPVNGTVDTSKSFYSLMRPPGHLSITLQSLEVNKLTIEQIKAAPPETEVYESLRAWMEENNLSTWQIWGHHSNFDYGFASEWERRCKPEKKIFANSPSWICTREMLKIARFCNLYPQRVEGDPEAGSTKLEHACKRYGLPTGGHNALNDAVAAAHLANELWKLLRLEISR